MKHLLILSLAVLAPSPAPAQVLHTEGPLPSFEVATIKPGVSGLMGCLTPSQTITLCPKETTRIFIGQAYGLTYAVGFRGPLVFGGPDWIDKEPYTVQMKIPDDIFFNMQKMSADEKPKQIRLMEQSLLAARYKLKVHFETREMPVYELVVAKDGLQLTPEKDDDSIKGSLLAGGGSAGYIHLIAEHATTVEICHNLFPFVDRPVIDKTGIKGRYSFKMNISSAGTMFDHGSLSANTGDKPGLFTAIQELGFKLQPTKAPIEVVVIDSIERPSPN